jgi:hypothetical protein
MNGSKILPRRAGFTNEEQKKMTLSQETLEGLKMTRSQCSASAIALTL